MLNSLFDPNAHIDRGNAHIDRGNAVTPYLKVCTLIIQPLRARNIGFRTGAPGCIDLQMAAK